MPRETNKLKFTKMQGAGNDYVYVDCFRDEIILPPAILAGRVADRHFGIGSDGLVLIMPSERADVRMRMFNSDGSESEMCGNAIRCVAKYVYDHGLCRKAMITAETGAGILPLYCEVENGKVSRVRVDMGEPILRPADVPTTLRALNGNDSQPVVDVPLNIEGKSFPVCCVSMGNPHCVTFVDEVTDAWVLGVGPKVEVNEHFPRKTNAEFVQVVTPTELRMRVWERGTGETLACGTGACATAVAAMLSGRTERNVVIHLTGGDLQIEWAADNHVVMTGPAVEVFSGELYL